jgi:hypothetical protein
VAYQGGNAGVGTAAVLCFTPGTDGALVANAGTAPLTLGGPGVVAGGGVLLPVGGGPVFVPGHQVIGHNAVDEALHCVQTGTAGGSITWANLV